jgi:hypothetical protein
LIYLHFPATMGKIELKRNPFSRLAAKTQRKTGKAWPRQMLFSRLAVKAQRKASGGKKF